MKLLVFVAILAFVVLSLSQAATISNSGNTWSPSSVTIKRGESVLWRYGAIHNVAQSSSADATTRQTGGFYSGAVGANTNFTQTFNTAGTFYFICEPHAAAGMRGSVVVSSSATFGLGLLAIVAVFLF